MKYHVATVRYIVRDRIVVMLFPMYIHLPP